LNLGVIGADLRVVVREIVAISTNLQLRFCR